MQNKTSFTEAILGLFGDFGKRLDLAGLPPDAVRAYLFGGCAVHMYARNRVSTDVDVERYRSSEDWGLLTLKIFCCSFATQQELGMSLSGWQARLHNIMSAGI